MVTELTPAKIKNTDFNIYLLVDLHIELFRVKQAWFMVGDSAWRGKPGEYFLRAIPQGRMLLLDLDAYSVPIYPKTHSFYGQPFVWNIVHDYGGVLGLQGPLGTINQVGYCKVSCIAPRI